MTCYIVSTTNGLGHRFIDSIWVSVEHADDRVALVKRMMEMAGCRVATNEWWCWKTEAWIEDASLVQPEPVRTPMVKALVKTEKKKRKTNASSATA
jgi:hypothetical protein